MGMQTSTNSRSIVASAFEPLRTSRSITLAKFLGAVLLCAMFSHPPKVLAIAGPASVSLAWDRNPEPTAINYRVYYGAGSRQYTNSVDVGNLTFGSVSGLASGVSYFFAVTALDAAGLESGYSSEITFVPGGSSLRIRLVASLLTELTVTGPAGQAYDILASSNFTTWTTLGSVLAGLDGLATYLDAGTPGRAVRFYRALRKP